MPNIARKYTMLIIMTVRSNVYSGDENEGKMLNS